MYSFKPGVKIRGVRTEMVAVWPTIAQCYTDFGYECVITSVTDGKHEEIVHILGFATDFRTRHVSGSDMPAVVKNVKARLSDEFDVVLEGNHLHVEFDPR